MREITDRERIELFMRGLGARVRQPAKVFLTGGSTAVLHGWRDSTVDIDVRFAPELDELFRSLPELKERLHVNIELASPQDFIPPLPGWEERSIFIGREGKIEFFHYDLYSQALSKIERGHSQDTADVQTMLDKGFIEPQELLRLFEAIKPDLYRYPAIDAESFAKSVHRVIRRDV
jgi:hypothetical protein